ncbi:MAG: polymerase sigma factor RpoE [Pseudomonadota bacterium]
MTRQADATPPATAAPGEPEPADEAELLARARGGHQAAYGTLVRLHQSRLRLQLRRLTGGDAALADELAQDAFVQAWRRLGDYRGEARWSTWVYRIAYNLYLMHRRSPVGRLAALTDPASQDGTDTTAAADTTRLDGLSGAGPQADHAHLQHARRVDVARALARLDEAERQALLHCYWLDLSHQEAALVLGLPLGTLKTQVARAKARLRDWLAAWAQEQGP